MARNSTTTRRIFGGKEPVGQGNAAYQRELLNPGNQATAETLAVATHRRVFPGPKENPWWSYHVNVVTAAGAGSTLKFYYSNLPNPDPTDATHWVDSAITAIDLTSTTADAVATVVDKAPAWIKAEAIVLVSTGTIWAYVRADGWEV